MTKPDISTFSVPKKTLNMLQKNCKYNETIIDYYDRLLTSSVSNGKIKLYDNKIASMKMCNTIWDVEKYKKQEVLDMIRTNLCRDRFCNNCKKVRQAQRMAKFVPAIKSKKKEMNMSQMVLTVRNVIDDGSGKQLRQMIEIMFRAFASLIEYLKGKKKIKGLDFKSLVGYKGAIRSLEVTYKKANGVNEYHPHLHILVGHTQYFGKKKYRNDYSYDKKKRRNTRFFNEVEILIQKIWRLLVDDITEHLESGAEGSRARINKKRIDELSLGYSCTIDKFEEDDFIELFKYMTKADGKKKDDEESSLMTFDNFKTLLFGLKGVRQIQGYGCFFNIKDSDDMGDETMKEYEELIAELKQKETPEQSEETLQGIQKSKYKVISRKKVPASLRPKNK
ncbi:protein rep [Priestia megaterium]|uniref:protein rep n=1 Tax=Priestia megaterium TaxID=1404 RepID=UPI0035E1649E